MSTDILESAVATISLAQMVSGRLGLTTGGISAGAMSFTRTRPRGESYLQATALFKRSEPHTPTIAPVVPTILCALKQLLRYEPFSKRREAHVHQTEQANALPASWRCPG